MKTLQPKESRTARPQATWTFETVMLIVVEQCLEAKTCV